MKRNAHNQLVHDIAALALKQANALRDPWTNGDDADYIQGKINALESFAEDVLQFAQPEPKKRTPRQKVYP